VTADIAAVVLRVGMDGAVTRVPFVADKRGDSGALIREQIGCSTFDVISLDRRTDMWVDDEAIVNVDVEDREALIGVLNIVATVIANHCGRPGPVFGAVVITGVSGPKTTPLSTAQLVRMEQLAEMAVTMFADRLPAREIEGSIDQQPTREIEGSIETMTLTVKLENAYSDGHCSESVETVAVEPVDDVEKLWEQLQEFTGDGHGADDDLGYCYTITVLEAPGRPELVGLSNEWVGA